MAETAVATEEKADPQQNQESTEAQTVEFPEAEGNAGNGEGASIDILLDMEVPVTVTIGHTEIPIHHLLKLSAGSVLKLDKPIDAPVELYLKDAKFATGEIVVVEDKFAVRIKEIVGRQEADKTGKD